MKIFGKDIDLNILLPCFLLIIASGGLFFYAFKNKQGSKTSFTFDVFPKIPSRALLEEMQSPPPESLDDLKSDEEQGPFELTLKIQKGDTLMSVLSDARIDKNDAHEVSSLLQKHFKAKDLKPHHEIYLTYAYDEKESSKKHIESLYFRPNINTEFRIHIDENDQFVFEKSFIKLNKVTHLAEGHIRNSLYIDAGKEGVPVKILHQMIQAFSYDIDFQRSFQPGDAFSLLYTMNADEEGLREEPGELLYASLSLKGKILPLYHFKSAGGMNYYTLKGEGVKKGLLRTPIDGARISSRFGRRKHPILGYTKDHKGIDFAAPTGTPIMASGDGVVVQVGPYSTYGNYIKIRHNNELSTAYAHLSRFAKGLRVHRPIKQGQVIGYVGTTGNSTGPHLHYELIRHNVQVDPATVTMMPTSRLEGKDLESFRQYVKSIDQQLRVLAEENRQAEKAPRETVSCETVETTEAVPQNENPQENLSAADPSKEPADFPKKAFEKQD